MMYLKMAGFVVLFIVLIGCIILTATYVINLISMYFVLRSPIYENSRTVIRDTRILGLIERAEDIVEPGVVITYYSNNTRSKETTAPWQFFINAGYHVEGMWPNKNRNIIFINDVLLEKMTDQELLFVIGHELGHAKSDGQMIGRGLIYAHKLLFYNVLTELDPHFAEEVIYSDYIEAEFEADEYGIKCSDVETAISVLMKVFLAHVFKGEDTRAVEARQLHIAHNYEKE